jgi:hypothetical protein
MHGFLLTLLHRGPKGVFKEIWTLYEYEIVMWDSLL